MKRNRYLGRVVTAYICLLLFASTNSAQETVVPIVNGITLLGGAQDGRWVAAEKTASALKDRTEFKIINLNKVEKVSTIFGTKGERQEVCLENPVIRFDESESDDPGESRPFALGANARWNPVPRIPQPISSNDKTYSKLAADFLKTNGIAGTKIVITQAYRIDLEGDGQDEIIIAGNYYKQGMAEGQSEGDYSFILLRRIVKGKPRNVLVEGEFFTSKVVESADYNPPNSRGISAIADLNGDGKMEFVVWVVYYEGNRSAVFEIKSGKLVKVLESECYV